MHAESIAYDAWFELPTISWSLVIDHTALSEWVERNAVPIGAGLHDTQAIRMLCELCRYHITLTKHYLQEWDGSLATAGAASAITHT